MVRTGQRGVLEMGGLLDRRILAAAVCLLLASTALSAAPGDVTSVVFDRSIPAAEIDSLAVALFENSEPPGARYDVDVFLIEYETTDLDGTPTPSLLQLFVPRLSEPDERPMYVFGTGSTGLVDACRPSREHLVDIEWGLYRTHVLAHAGQGTIGVMPDYMNFSVTGEIQPYFISVAEGRVMLDAIRAARSYIAGTDYFAQPAPGAFVAGYSQGGHAAFATADLRDEYAPEVELAGIIGYGPSTDIFNLFREFTVSIPLVVYSYATFYGEDRFDPSLVLADRWLDSLAHDVTSMCIGAVQRFYPREPEPLYRPEFTDALLNGTMREDYPGIARLMEINSSGLSGHGIPALILEGTEDTVVSLESQTEFVGRLCDAGSAVRYIVYEGARHDTRQVGFADAVEWMYAIAGGEPAPSDCSEY